MSEKEKLGTLVPLKIKGVFEVGLSVRPVLEKLRPSPKWVLKIQAGSFHGVLTWNI